ncbi:phage Gp37/Gp68 family protein [Streptomyces synnematoformans]|uniref:Phage Gp37/Gp68 family protein n=1 Tax=Streptomyces synnematoformans TaxID=415721 RepID=A0ABP5IYT0_9ACTN
MTKISWTDETWNPATGCDRVSPGCDRCYAITSARIRAGNPHPKVAEAYAGTTQRTEAGLDWTGTVNLIEERLEIPLHWRKPRRVFVNSMSDLFHAQVPSEFIAKVFAVMALTPRHTYQVLTKRHARMRSLLNNEAFERQVLVWAHRLKDDAHEPSWNPGERRFTTWPLPNCWLGVSVENQRWADTRIPALLDTPASVRFISAEPLLGPVDLTAWMPPISPVPASGAPESWADWTWPGWVPADVRTAVENFWSEDQGRSPAHWIRNMHEQGAPAFGATLSMDDGFGQNPPQIVGRYVHAWNNIGRLVLDGDEDREFAYTSFSRADRSRARGIDWVIVGGESGPGARAMHPQWARNVRDQCVAADVPLHFKQWGSWGPAPFIVRVCAPDVGWQGTAEELAAAKADSEARGATHVHTGNWYEEDGERHYWLHEIGHKPWSLERVGLPAGMEPIRRWGVYAAGRELDGQVWDGFPEVAHA